MKLLQLFSPVSPERLPDLVLMTDSSISPAGRPVFLPDFAERWVCAIAPAFRIGRLGKTISRRFAHRYVDGVTVAARLIPLDLIDNGYRLSPWANAFDGAVSTGRFLPPDACREFVVNRPDGSLMRYDFNNWDIYTTIEAISRYFILKNGDIIVPYGPIEQFHVDPGTRIHIESGDRQPILDFKIK